MSDTPLRLYNSLTRATESFAPIDPANIRVYSCGPTVYHYAHIGNLRAYVFTDTLSRVLTWKASAMGWGRLTHVINITDVGHLTSDADAGDDKMEAAARAQGRDIWAIAKHYTEAFKQNLKDLNVREPAFFPLATDHVPQMIAFAEAIAERHCYQIDSGLYFDTSTVPDYGLLARARDDDGEGRIDPVAGKRHPQDFAIWRRSGADEHRQMEWDSPWGRGAPGWHLECSVMSRQYLGDRFDIHTGGVDHREIHHPNEIAQNQARCECANTGANWWMHNNFLVDRTGKMSKSSGDTLTLQTLVDRGFHPLAYRLMCLQAQYRSEMEFSWQGLAAAQVRLKRLVQFISSWLESLPSFAPEKDRQKLARRIHQMAEFDEAISDDLNTPKALAIIDNMIRMHYDIEDKLSALSQMDHVLGLNLLQLARADLRVRPASATIEAERVAERLFERREARRSKDFTRADAIRDELIVAGVEVMDGDPLGWDWRPNLPEEV